MITQTIGLHREINTIEFSHPMDTYSQRLCYQDLWQQACYILLDAPAPLDLYIEFFYHRTDIFIVEFFIKVVKSCLN